MASVRFEVSVDLEAMLAEDVQVERWGGLLEEENGVEIPAQWEFWSEDQKWEFVCRTVAFQWMMCGDYSDFCSWVEG